MSRTSEKRGARTVLQLERYIPALITLLENRLTNTASVIYRHALGMGATETRIVVLLGTRSNISGHQIGQAIGLDKAAVSRALKSLETMGVISVAANRGRRRDISLSPYGRKVHDTSVEISLLREERLLQNLTRAEHEMLIDLLNRMIQQMPSVSAVVDEIKPYKPDKSLNSKRGAKKR